MAEAFRAGRGVGGSADESAQFTQQESLGGMAMHHQGTQSRQKGFHQAPVEHLVQLIQERFDEEIQIVR